MMTALTINANANTADRYVLVNLKSFHILVESMDQVEKDNGLDSDVVKTWVELRLRTLGLPVTEIKYPNAIDSDKSGAYLYINISMIKNSDYTCIYSTSVSLGEDVKLRRPPYNVAYCAKT